MSNNYIGDNIPKLGFGLMRLPMIGSEIDIEETKSMVDLFMKKGFTYFDTAYPYINGKSEIAVKEILVDRFPRESFQLASKMPVWLCNKYEDFQPLFDVQLERTGAKYFDYYLLHALEYSKLSKLDEIGGWDFIREMKEKGLIKHIGFSFHDKADILDQILTAHPETEFVQLQINYADWDDEQVQSRLCYEVAVKHNKPVIIMEPVKGGGLSGMSPSVQKMLKDVQPDLSIASWAIRYAASLDNIITVLSGMSNMEQLNDNINIISDFKPLTTQEYNVLDSVVEALRNVDTIPCTTCKYCVDDCPKKINIPEILATYNTYKIYQELNSAKSRYNWVINNRGKASDCIACGLCEEHCPQHIQIIDSLSKIATLLEDKHIKYKL